MLDATVYRWNGHSFVPFAPPVPEHANLLAAETWLVDDSMTVGWLLHMRRFSRALAAVYPHTLNRWEFYTAVVELIPHTGQYYPRLECSQFDDRIELIMRMRPNPTPHDNVVLVTAHSDDRLHPLQKGPDLAYQMQLRRSAQMQGADEMVFLNDDGNVISGALSSIVWWQHETLHVVPSSSRKFMGITEEIICAIAEASGIHVETTWAKPADLLDSEVWMLSSTYGIRPATAWLHAAEKEAMPSSDRAKIWQRRLSSIAVSLRR